MLNDVTLENFEDRFELVELRGKNTVQSAHCALYVVAHRNKMNY